MTNTPEKTNCPIDPVTHRFIDSFKGPRNIHELNEALSAGLGSRHSSKRASSVLLSSRESGDTTNCHIDPVTHRFIDSFKGPRNIHELNRALSIEQSGDTRNSSSTHVGHKVIQDSNGLLSHRDSPSALNQDTITPLDRLTLADRWNFLLASAPRQHWHTRYDFILAGIGFCVGLGNLWRFPAKAYAHGGGAFLIPYVILHFVIALPMFMIEVTVGQYGGKGPIQMWALNYAATGIGITCVIRTAIDSIWYNRVIAWVMFYMFASMQSPLPWTQCPADGVAMRCFHPKSNISFPLCDSEKFNNSNPNSTVFECKCSGQIEDDFDINHWCFSNRSSYVDLTKRLPRKNCSDMIICTNKTVSPSLLYFYKYIKLAKDNVTVNLENIGEPIWYMCYCLLLSWIVVGFCLMGGISTASRVLYFTVMFPYFILFCLLINAITLDGAVSGMTQYVIPKWRLLLDINVWKVAGLDIMYGFGFASGGLVMISSYNRYSHNVYRDMFIVALFDFMTSFFAGLVVYANIGVLRVITGESGSDIYESIGENLTFVVLADAISRVEWPTFWAVNFFCMMFTMAIDSQFFLVEVVLSSLKDEFDILRKHRLTLTIVYCMLGFFLGVPLVTPGGEYIHEVTALAENHSFDVLIITFILVLVWGYGGNRLMNDLTDMLGFEPWPRWYWLISWVFTVPVLCIYVGCDNLTNIKFKHLDGKNMAVAVKVVSSFLLILMLSPLPIVFFYTIYKAEGKSVWQKLHRAVQPTKDWVSQVTSRTMFELSHMAVRRSTNAVSRVTSSSDAKRESLTE